MNGRKPQRLTIALLFAAAVFLVIGAARGEAQTVLIKATNICLECIGIG